MLNRAVLASCLLLGGCTSLSEIALGGAEIFNSSYLVTAGKTTRSSQWALARQTHFYLARNNELTDLNSRNSEVLTALISNAIQASFRPPAIGLLPEGLSQARASADRLAADFLIFPSIIVWDDHASNWTETFDALREDTTPKSRLPLGLDKAAVQLIVMHAASGEVVDIVRLRSSSGVLTLYEDTPDKVVLPLLTTFFADLVAASR